MALCLASQPLISQNSVQIISLDLGNDRVVLNSLILTTRSDVDAICIRMNVALSEFGRCAWAAANLPKGRLV